MTHTKFYATCKSAYPRIYTIAMVYKFTTLSANALTADEFYEITGVTIEEYKAR